jgi:hypothetical protein
MPGAPQSDRLFIRGETTTMRKMLIATTALLMIATGPTFAGNDGPQTSQGDRNNIAGAGKQAFHDAKKAGHSDQRAGKLRDAAEAKAAADHSKAAKDDANGEIGVWISNNTPDQGE